VGAWDGLQATRLLYLSLAVRGGGELQAACVMDSESSPFEQQKEEGGGGGDSSSTRLEE
jgi:hypothetical protein